MEGFKTKQGYVMNLSLKARIVAEMAENRGVTLREIARQLGINQRTLQDYLTPSVRSEIRDWRAKESDSAIEDVDKAMLKQAKAGNVAAARLVYMRMAQKGEVKPLPSLEEMETELNRLKTLEHLKKKDAGDGATETQAEAGGVAG